MDPDQARKRLDDEKARFERELADLGNDPTSIDEPEDSGDEGVELDQAGRDGAIRDEIKRNLTAIDRAYERLDDGSYGKSIVSGEPIPDQRLEAIPWAERTVEEEEATR